MAQRRTHQQNDDGDDRDDDVKYVDCPICWGQKEKCRYCRSTGLVHPDDVDPILDVLNKEKRKKTLFLLGSVGVLVFAIIGLVLVGFFTKDPPRAPRVKESDKEFPSGLPDLKMDLPMSAVLKGFEGHIDKLEKTAVKDPTDGWAYMGYTSDREKQGTNTFCSMVVYGSEERVTHALFCATIPMPENSDPNMSPDLLKRNTQMLELFLYNMFRGQVPPVARETVDMARKNPGRETMEVARGLKIKCKYSPADKKFTVDVR